MSSTLSVAFGIIVTLEEELSPESVPDVTSRQLREGSSISKENINEYILNKLCFIVHVTFLTTKKCNYLQQSLNLPLDFQKTLKVPYL